MIKVRVPGTSANIGPGFDAFGLALSIYNTFSFEEKNDGKLTIRGLNASIKATPIWFTAPCRKSLKKSVTTPKDFISTPMWISPSAGASAVQPPASSEDFLGPMP